MTGWPPGEGTRGVKACFDAWLVGFGGDSGIPRDEQALMQQVRAFLEKHGDSRFQPVAKWEAPDGDEAEPENRYPVRNRVGFRERRADGRGYDYFVLTGAMAEVCGTGDVKRAVDVLDAHGWLARKEPGRQTGKKLVAGDRFRGYFLTGKAMEG